MIAMQRTFEKELLEMASAALDALDENICVLDVTGNILLTNRTWSTFAEQNGATQESVAVGRNYLNICDTTTGDGAEDAATFAAGLRQVIAGGIEPFTMEYACHSPNQKRWFIGQITRFVQGSETRFVITHYNITRRRLAEDALRASQKFEAIGRLAGGMAHEFKNILATIMMNLDLSQRVPESERAEYHRDIQDSCEKASSLIDQLLAFSRQAIITPQMVDLADILSQQLHYLTHFLGKHIEITRRLPSNLPRIKGDKILLTQVVLNLCLNARDAMKKGGRLLLDLSETTLTEANAKFNPDRRPGRFLRLAVTDTGCGMNDQIKKKIFEPFFTTKEVGQGTGLGLATSQGIVHQHHGWIEVESVVGKGSTFTVFLPIPAEPPA